MRAVAPTAGHGGQAARAIERASERQRVHHGRRGYAIARGDEIPCEVVSIGGAVCTPLA